MKIVTIIGARPQFIKAANVSRALKNHPEAEEIIIHTGQHYDDNMSEVFFRELDIAAPDYNLGIGSGTHAAQTGLMMQGIEQILMNIMPDVVLIYGDTNSTLAGALAAVKIHIPVAHVEAGLRSFNRIMPEEINRIVADCTADLLFAPTLTAIRNLKNEGLELKTRFSGDVMYDSILYYKSLIDRQPGKYQVPGLPGNYLLATVHRAENTDNSENLSAILEAFGQSGQNIVLPLHPRTKRLLADKHSLPGNIMVIEPVGYLEMIRLISGADKILTDSGGLQKEAYFMGKPCITLRTETEWTETLHDGWNTITGTDPGKIVQAIRMPAPSAPRRNEFGDGNASGIIARFLVS
jgi:UDP-GlcNAc3NAcA epimerase